MGVAILATWVKMTGRAVAFKDDSGILGGFVQGFFNADSRSKNEMRDQM